MQPTRTVYEDTPAFIPVPADLQHRRSVVIVWPLTGADEAVTESVCMPTLPSLTEFRAGLPWQETHAGSFCQAMRDEDRY